LLVLVVYSTANDATAADDATTTTDDATTTDDEGWYDDVPWWDGTDDECPNDDAWTGSHHASSVTITTASKDS